MLSGTVVFLCGKGAKMISQYDIGDKILLVGTVTRICQGPGGEILYMIQESETPIEEGAVFARVAPKWTVLYEKQKSEWS